MLQAEAAVKGAQLVGAQLRARAQHAEHAARLHEAAAEKLRAKLADDVTAQERRCERNAKAYARMKRTLAANKGRATAGMMSAAVRELRPVEIVGLYEDTIESLEVSPSSP